MVAYEENGEGVVLASVEAVARALARAKNYDPDERILVEHRPTNDPRRRWQDFVPAATLALDAAQEAVGLPAFRAAPPR